jgi:pyruvate dehydrogenase E2 component (dihydrolipoamide acetyltransferase)
MDVEAYLDGYLREIYFEEGAVVSTDAVIALISTTADEPIIEDDPRPAPAVIGDQAVLDQVPDKKTRETFPTKSVLASPVAKKLAEENQIELSTITGSGPNGRITRKDVEAAIEKKQIKTEEIPTPAPPTESLSSMRRAIVERTVLSKTTIPHYYLTAEIDMMSAQAYVDHKKLEAKGVASSPTITDLIIWSCGQVLPNHPSLRASWQDGQINLHQDIHIGMVIGLEEGMIVPVVHNVDRHSISEIAVLTAALKRKASAGTLSVSDLTGGTFTVSNLGMYGVASFTAVINPPESAILALGSIRKKCTINEDEQIMIRPMMTATLSADHRIVDGVAAAKFLTEFQDTLTDIR